MELFDTLASWLYQPSLTDKYYLQSKIDLTFSDAPPVESLR